MAFRAVIAKVLGRPAQFALVVAVCYVAWLKLRPKDFSIGPTPVPVKFYSVAQAAQKPWFAKELPIVGYVSYPDGLDFPLPKDPARGGVLVIENPSDEPVWRIAGMEVGPEVLSQGCGPNYVEWTISVPTAPSEGDRQAHLRLSGKWVPVTLPFDPTGVAPKPSVIRQTAGPFTLTATPEPSPTPLPSIRYQLSVSGSEKSLLVLGEIQLTSNKAAKPNPFYFSIRPGDLLPYISWRDQVSEFRGEIAECDTEEIRVFALARKGADPLVTLENGAIVRDKSKSIEPSAGFDAIEIRHPSRGDTGFIGPKSTFTGFLSAAKTKTAYEAIGYRIRRRAPFSLTFSNLP